MKQRFRLIGFFLMILTGIAQVGYSEIYKRAPDVIPGTLPEMRDPAYWIARMKNLDHVILAPDEIQRMNEKYQRKISSHEPFKNVNPDRIPENKRLFNRPGHVLFVPELESMNPTEVAYSVRQQINSGMSYLRGSRYANVASIEYSESEIDSFEHEMALDLVGGEIQILYGITVRTTRQRIVPSWLPQEQGYPGHSKHSWDRWNLCVVKIGKPVRVLHRSRSGAYLFVLSQDGYGWVNTEDVALGDSKEIENYTEAGNFLICTGDRIPYYSDERCMYVSGWLRMGARVPLANTNNQRIILAPVRKTNGQFTTEKAWVAPDADVHIGFLPYTRRNIVTTAFKLLDNIYDWTGGWFGRNHDSNLRDIFACFGFELPYEGLLFTHYGQTPTVVYPDMDRKEQYRVILEHEPFVTLMNCESGGPHSNLLLGEYNGTPIVFDMHGYNYQLDDGTWLEVRRCCVGDITIPTYFLEHRITFLELK